MSDDEQRDERLKTNYWYFFDGKPVCMQMMEPWGAVTYPNQAAYGPNPEDPNGPPVQPALQMLRGILHVYPDVGPGGVPDVMFVLETNDPSRDKSEQGYKLFIGIKRELVAYVTVTERSLISA